MGPKKTKSASKIVDDFLAESAVTATEAEIAANKVKVQEQLSELKDKYINLQFPASGMLNNAQLEMARIVTNIFVGIGAGIFGMGLLHGVAFWLAMGLVTSAVFAVRISTLGQNDRGDGSRYFASVLDSAFSGSASNFAIFMVLWVMFYNIVYVV